MFLFQIKDDPLPSNKKPFGPVYYPSKWLIFIDDEETRSKGAEHGVIIKLDEDEFKNILEKSKTNGIFDKSKLVKFAKEHMKDGEYEHVVKPIREMKNGDVLIENTYEDEYKEDGKTKETFYRINSNFLKKLDAVIRNPAKKPDGFLKIELLDSDPTYFCPCNIKLAPPPKSPPVSEARSKGQRRVA